MVAEQTRSKRQAPMDRPRVGLPSVSASLDAATMRQPSLAEEIDEVEREQRVTKALQATVETHGMKHGIITSSPKGRKPQTKGSTEDTPRHTPKHVKTPSPITSGQQRRSLGNGRPSPRGGE